MIDKSEPCRRPLVWYTCSFLIAEISETSGLQVLLVCFFNRYSATIEFQVMNKHNYSTLIPDEFWIFFS
jgi:hypothetical protein